jgi:hypothetical protein
LQTPSMTYRARLILTGWSVVISGALIGCASTPPLSASTPTASIAPTANGTKPASTQAPIAPPTHVTWAVDKSADAARPYILVLFFDGGATAFRIVDASARVVLRVPIAGSGIFGPDTCVQRVHPSGKTENFTWIGLDTSTMQQFMANARSYRVELDTIGGATINLPIIDSGCRGG